MLFTTAALLLAAAAPVTAAQFSDVKVVDVAVSNFRFMPHMIRLQAGQPVILRLINGAGESHDFSAPIFFQQASVGETDAALISNGRVELRPRQTVELRLVPAAGEFSFKCTKPFHAALGMKGTIQVE